MCRCPRASAQSSVNVIGQRRLIRFSRAGCVAVFGFEPGSDRDNVQPESVVARLDRLIELCCRAHQWPEAVILARAVGERRQSNQKSKSDHLADRDAARGRTNNIETRSKRISHFRKRQMPPKSDLVQLRNSQAFLGQIGKVSVKVETVETRQWTSVWQAHRQDSPNAQHAIELGIKGKIVADMLKHIDDIDLVDGAVGEWERPVIANQRIAIDLDEQRSSTDRMPVQIDIAAVCPLPT